MAETERFELSVPKRELHLSRVKLAFWDPDTPTTVPPRNAADLLLYLAIPAPRPVARDALYSLHLRWNTPCPECSGTPGGPLVVDQIAHVSPPP